MLSGLITNETDIHCYSCEEEREDKKLGDHLAHFGIDFRTQTKTEQSLQEMVCQRFCFIIYCIQELEQNLNFSVNSNVDEGQVMKPLYGPGLTGLVNLGNSCYMSSVMQVLFHSPSFLERYYKSAEEHAKKCTKHARHAMCFECQVCIDVDNFCSLLFLFVIFLF